MVENSGAPSFRTKALLVLFGSFLGLALVIPAAWYLLGRIVPEGASFSSLGDVRAAINTRDERDKRSDGNVTLRSLLRVNPSDDIIYELLPNLNVRFQRVPVRTNAFGMRQGDVTREKPPGIFRVALLGDSFAFGWGVEEEKTFARVLEDNLNRNGPSDTIVQVLNFGVPGYSTFQETAKFLSDGVTFSPDAVVVYFVNNDFGLPFFIGNAQGGGLLDSVSFVRRAWRSEDQALKEQNAALVARSDANRALLKLSAELDVRKIPLFLALNPSSTWEKDLRRLWAVRRAPSINFIPLKDPLAELIAKENIQRQDLSLPTDPHPSAVKHRLIAEVLADRIRPFVK